MKTWVKIVIVCACGAAVWGLAYGASLLPDYNMVFASFAAGISGICSVITGFKAN
ncbi:MAG: hypothetical protein M0P69_12260 [Bacteroidales bacterium]|nr:hypothetical protein [Bacteroidales bacterium]